MSQQKVFVTGATGFIGSNLAYELFQQGHKIVFLVRSVQGVSAEKRLEQSLKVIDPKFRIKQYPHSIIIGDVQLPNLGLNPERLKGKIDAIFHCAGSISFSRRKTEQTWQTNVEGVRRVIEFSENIEAKRFHHVSTVYVVGDSEGDFTENSKGVYPNKFFNNPYERTKYMSEVLVRDSKLDFSIYRPGIVIGAQNGQSLSFDGYYTFHKAFWALKDHIKSKFSQNPKMFKEAGISFVNKKLILPVIVKCAFDATINLVPVDWLVKTIVRLSQKDLSRGETFHLTHTNPPNVKWLIRNSLDILGITGVDFANLDVNVEHGNETLDEIQTMIERGIRSYIPYITQRHNFLNFNTRAVLNGEYKDPPSISPEYLKKILRYAVRHKFRRNKEWVMKKG